MPNKSWFDVQARAAGKSDEAEVLIYDSIGAYGVSARTFVSAIKALDAKRIVVRINSDGGDVFDGTAIYNALKDHPADIIVHVDGVAASAASFIAMAGDEITIAKSAYMMVHEAWGVAQGPAEDMRKLADILEKMNGAIAQMYADRSGKSAEEWRGVMAAETWYLGQEAVDAGLADQIEATAEADPVRAQFNYAIFNKIPDPLRRAWGVNENAQKPGLNVLTVPCGIDSPAANPKPRTAMNREEIISAAQSWVDAGDILSVTLAFSDEDVVIVEKAALPAPEPTEQQNRLRNAIVAKVHPGLLPKVAAANELLAAFPGDKGFCMDQLAANATMADAHQAWAKALNDKLAQAEADKSELQKRLDLAGKGRAPLNIADGTTPDPAPDPSAIEEPKARAEAEWDKVPGVRNGFENKQNYVNYRVSELSGSLRVINR